MTYAPLAHFIRREPIAKAKDQSDLDALAEKLEPALARAVRAYLNAQADAASLEALTAALKAGDIGEIEAIISNAGAAHTGKIANALQDAAWAGGAYGANQVREGKAIRDVTFQFGRLNPSLVAWLQSYELNLIRQIDGKTREAIRAALVDGQIKGANPVEQARAVRDVIGLTPRQAKAVANYRRELETFHQKRGAKSWGLGEQISRRNGRQTYAVDEKGEVLDNVKERRLRDFRYDRTLQRAMDTGKALKPEQIDRMVDAYRRKYLKLRAETIARTESLRAANAGALDAWRQAIDEGAAPRDLVFKLWETAHDERECPTCRETPKLNPKWGVPLNAMFQTPNGPVSMPPLHPDCRCVPIVRVYLREQLARLQSA